MERDVSEKKRIPGFVKVILVLLILAAIYCGRRYFIDSQHPYKELDVIGTWDYEYSVSFDVDEKMAIMDCHSITTREGKECFEI